MLTPDEAPKEVPTEVRLAFEDLIYKNYTSARTLHMVMHGKKGMAEIDRDAPIPRERYLEKRTDGAYVTAGVNLNWMGFKLALDYLSPAIEQANLWAKWLTMQDEIRDQMPAGYTLVMGYERANPDALHGAFISLLDPDQNELAYPDPEDMDSPGLVFRIVRSVVDAAHRHEEANR